jgi:hypothetical protein
MNEHFTKQLEQGAAEMFFYAVETSDPHTISIRSHKGTLESFPNLVYIRHLTDSMPLFKDSQ